MHRRLAVFVAALALTVAPSHAAPDKSDWTADDTTREEGGDRLMNESQFDAAETLYRALLDRHPDSPAALIDHVKALNALGRHDQALRESRHAVELEPRNAAATQSLGMTLVCSHQNGEAISALRTSLALEPDDQTSLIWLAIAYLHDGQKPQADTILQTQVLAGDTYLEGQTARIIGGTFHQAGDGALAVEWWRRSYDLGYHDAARYLTWAYASGTDGVPYDEAASDYWARRTLNGPFAWFPRLPVADAIVGWAHGWGVVAIILASAAILPGITVSLVAFLPARGLINEPALPWMERARRAYPFMVLLATSVMLLPLVDLVNVSFYPSFLLPIPRWILLWLAFAVGVYTSNAVVVRWTWFYRKDAGTAWQNMTDIGTTLLIYLPSFAIFGVMGIYLPDHFGWPAALMIAAAILAYFYIQCGGWIRLARVVRLITLANPDLVADAAELAVRWKIPAPSVWTIRWRKANALAFMFANAIVVTEKLQAILTRAEIKAVLAHELAHLCEDRVTRTMRLLVPLLLLPLFTLNLWSSSYILIALGGSYLLFLVGAMIMRRRARRMEERADSFGKDAESEAGVYPLALAKIYEANLIPAVMPGKRKVHPHLYDRLLAAGITPDYPRPRPPGRWGGIAGLLVVVLKIGACAGIWLALF